MSSLLAHMTPTEWPIGLAMFVLGLGIGAMLTLGIRLLKSR
ncbi:MAG: hypothetical protein AAF961_07510 [Planctomycetota bacterium]